jgi:hypothetical protein
MKTARRFSMYLPLASLLLIGVLAAPAAAQKQVPFKGTFQGQDSDTGFTPTTVTVATTGTGLGTHLGQFSFTQETTVNVTNGTDTGSARLIAANGDSINVTIVGSGEPTPTPDVFSITETWTITGGTGRFAGAQGTAIVERLASGVTFLTSGSFHGTITSPGASTVTTQTLQSR